MLAFLTQYRILRTPVAAAMLTLTISTRSAATPAKPASPPHRSMHVGRARSPPGVRCQGESRELQSTQFLKNPKLSELPDRAFRTSRSNVEQRRIGEPRWLVGVVCRVYDAAMDRPRPIYSSLPVFSSGDVEDLIAS